MSGCVERADSRVVGMVKRDLTRRSPAIRRIAIRSRVADTSSVGFRDDPGIRCVCPPGLKHSRSTSVRSQQNMNPPVWNSPAAQRRDVSHWPLVLLTAFLNEVPNRARGVIRSAGFSTASLLAKRSCVGRGRAITDLIGAVRLLRVFNFMVALPTANSWSHGRP